MNIQSSALDSVPSSPYSSSPISSTTTYTSPSLPLASSSIDSSSSSIPSTSSSPLSSPRCAGLDLLVKAIYLVTAGSIIGVPYIQRRVIRRRSRRSKNLIFDHAMFFPAHFNGSHDSSGIGGNGDDNCLLIKKQRRAKKTLTSKFQDSVLQTWRPQSRYGRNLSKLVIKL